MRSSERWKRRDWTGKRGRQPDYSDAAIQTCLTMKVLFGMAICQTTGFVESLLRLMGLDWDVPDFSTLSRHQKTLKVNIPYRGSDGPLHLLVDSTGIKVEGEREWNARKHGGAKRRVWRKIHIEIDEKSLETRAAEFTTGDVGDAPMLPELLDQIPPEQEIATVTADGAFDTRKCHDAIAARGAAAIIPPRTNAKPWKPDTAGAVARNDILRTSNCLGRTIWRRWSGYYRRSRAETKMHCVKLLGQRLSAREFDRLLVDPEAFSYQPSRLVVRLDRRPDPRRRRLLVKRNQHASSLSRTSRRIDLAMNRALRRGYM